jgi:hypothetical protein
LTVIARGCGIGARVAKSDVSTIAKPPVRSAKNARHGGVHAAVHQRLMPDLRQVPVFGGGAAVAAAGSRNISAAVVTSALHQPDLDMFPPMS